MHEMTDFMKELFFEVQKEFWDERGRGARYRLTRIGVPFFEEKIGNDLIDKEYIKKWLINNDFCKDISIDEDDFSVKISVENCCLLNTRDKWEKVGVSPLACPIANAFMYSIELDSGMAPELLPIESQENSCKLTLAKMGTSAVLKKE